MPWARFIVVIALLDAGGCCLDAAGAVAGLALGAAMQRDQQVKARERAANDPKGRWQLKAAHRNVQRPTGDGQSANGSWCAKRTSSCAHRASRGSSAGFDWAQLVCATFPG